jgi:hypothetical protein
MSGRAAVRVRNAELENEQREGDREHPVRQREHSRAIQAALVAPMLGLLDGRHGRTPFVRARPKYAPGSDVHCARLSAGRMLREVEILQLPGLPHRQCVVSPRADA